MEVQFSINRMDLRVHQAFRVIVLGKLRVGVRGGACSRSRVVPTLIKGYMNAGHLVFHTAWSKLTG